MQLWNASKTEPARINATQRAFRDSCIQRFEYTIDIFWKYLKLYMQDYQKMNIVLASPRGILQTARNSNLISIDELKQLLNAVSDRNLTSHTYNEELATEIVNRIPDHYQLINTIAQRLVIQ
jgi:nucleotidyltransferase substrate binding protein (TIGR01987 family)